MPATAEVHRPPTATCTIPLNVACTWTCNCCGGMYMYMSLMCPQSHGNFSVSVAVRATHPLETRQNVHPHLAQDVRKTT